VNPFRNLGDTLAVERERWPLWTPVGLGAGITLYFALPLEPSLWMLAAYLARQHYRALIALFILLGFAVGLNAALTVIDDPELWHHGAHTIYFRDGGMRVEYVRERRGLRPWSVGWKQ
jgi:hypothetical protein